MPTEVSPNEHMMRKPGSLQLDPSGEGVAIDETQRLIASNKVEGTPVYKRDGEQLGSVYNFMVDKYSGQVAYAVMSFGGFLGLDESYHPLPWKVLTYDTRLECYVIDLDREAPVTASAKNHSRILPSDSASAITTARAERLGAGSSPMLPSMSTLISNLSRCPRTPSDRYQKVTPVAGVLDYV